MAPANLTRLLNFAEREFKSNRAAPARRKFKGMKLDFSKFDMSWEKRRGKAVRLMAVLLRDDDQALFQRVSADDHSARAFDEAAAWFKKEAAHLRRTAGLFETAAARIESVLSRFRTTQVAV